MNTVAIAHWLDFLRRAKGVSIAELAKAHDMRRSNLTTFINSGGKPGAVAKDKAVKALVGLGVHVDGTLCPGLHRWQVTDAAQASVMADILSHNVLSWGTVLLLRQGSGFLMLRYGRLTHVFVELSPDPLDTLFHASDANPVFADVTRVELGQDGDAMAQSLWMDADESTVLDHFKALREIYPVRVPVVAADAASTTSRG